MASTGTARSTRPEAMALAGMLACRGPEPSLACARVSPPCSLIALMPSVPSLPLPDSTIPMAYSLWSSASAAKKKSIGVRSRLPHGADAQMPLLDVKHRIGRRHVDVIAPDRLVVLGDQDRHAGVARQDLRQQAFPLGGEMGDDDKGHAEVGRHGAEQALERLHSSGGGAHANDGKRRVHGGPRLPRRRRQLLGSAAMPEPTPGRARTQSVSLNSAPSVM